MYSGSTIDRENLQFKMPCLVCFQPILEVQTALCGSLASLGALKLYGGTLLPR